METNGTAQKSPEVTSHTYSQLVFDTMERAINGAGRTRYSYAKE
jgi:hypothetical protein